MGLCSLPVIYLEINYGGCSEDNGDLLQNVPCMHRSSQLLTLQQATSYPRLHQRLLDTHGQAWVSLLWGHCSFWVLVYTMFCLYPPGVCFPPSCVSSGGSMLRLMLTSSKRVYAIRRSISSSVVPFSSCLQLFPAWGSFKLVSSSHHVAKDSYSDLNQFCMFISTFSLHKDQLSVV